MTVVPSWVTKLPDDMTLEELQQAKGTMESDLAEVVAEIDWRRKAINSVAAQINTRYGINTGGFPHPSSYAEYPREQVETEWGGSDD